MKKKAGVDYICIIPNELNKRLGKVAVSVDFKKNKILKALAEIDKMARGILGEANDLIIEAKRYAMLQGDVFRRGGEIIELDLKKKLDPALDRLGNTFDGLAKKARQCYIDFDEEVFKIFPEMKK